MSSSTDLQQVKQGLVDAGVEIYRTRPEEIQVAERIRLHIMDSGIRVRHDLAVEFTARSQRSDFPSVDPDELFGKVRERIGREAEERGYAERTSRTVDVKDPMDEARVLDTWHEITYSKIAEDLDALVAEVQWALALEKYVTP